VNKKNKKKRKIRRLRKRRNENNKIWRDETGGRKKITTRVDYKSMQKES
jgi:hypothetical protein